MLKNPLLKKTPQNKTYRLYSIVAKPLTEERAILLKKQQKLLVSVDIIHNSRQNWITKGSD